MALITYIKIARQETPIPGDFHTPQDARQQYIRKIVLLSSIFPRNTVPSTILSERRTMLRFSQVK